MKVKKGNIYIGKVLRYLDIQKSVIDPLTNKRGVISVFDNDTKYKLEIKKVLKNKFYYDSFFENCNRWIADSKNKDANIKDLIYEIKNNYLVLE